MILESTTAKSTDDIKEMRNYVTRCLESPDTIMMESNYGEEYLRPEEFGNKSFIVFEKINIRFIVFLQKEGSNYVWSPS